MYQAVTHHFFIIALIFLAGCTQTTHPEQGTTPASPPPAGTIAEIVAARPELSTLADAFHVSELEVVSEIGTMHGAKVKIVPGSASSLWIGEARVVTADIPATNGVIHIVDGLLLPEGIGIELETRSIYEVLSEDGRFGTFVSLINMTPLMTTLDVDRRFTVFAPTDEAFDALPAERLQDWRNNPARLAYVLNYHVVAERFTLDDILALGVLSLGTLQAGEELHITQEASIMYIDNARIIEVDVSAANGVIHVIDAVLIP